jgi:hypothetical protein
MDRCVHISIEVEFDDLQGVPVGPEHHLQPPQHDFIVIHQCDAKAFHSPTLGHLRAVKSTPKGEEVDPL